MNLQNLSHVTSSGFYRKLDVIPTVKNEFIHKKERKKLTEQLKQEKQLMTTTSPNNQEIPLKIMLTYSLA